MYTKEKQAMKAISQYAGQRLDFVQGGGGNTSYKFDDKIMAIKASGYSLAEVEEDKGYVTVDYAALKREYDALLTKKDADVEKESLDINLNNISLLEGMDSKRPSVEVGFHSFLKRAVVHTHSVYSNLLCCAEEGREMAKEIFGGSEYGYIYIPFINPGFELSMHIKEECAAFERTNGKAPELIFMESHGIVSTSDDYEEAIAIHDKANEMIIDYFGAKPFPKPKIAVACDGFVSDTPFIGEFIQAFKAGDAYFDDTILYPDQLVYLGGNLGKTIHISADDGKVTYETGMKQAKTVEEILLGVTYIISELARSGKTLKLLCQEGVDFIRNWESEKYRAQLVK